MDYSKKDLEKIEEYLIVYKKELIQKEKLKNIYEKLEDLRMFIKKNNIKYQDDMKKIIDLIEEVNNKDVSLDEKYEELKVCFNLLKEIDRNMSVYILELITLVIK